MRADLALLGFVWLLLASQAPLAAVLSGLGDLGGELATLIVFAAAAVATSAAAWAGRPFRPRAALRLRTRIGPGLIALAAGFVGLPAWLAAAAVVGHALGLEPLAAQPLPDGGSARFVANVLLAPWFEELLYRGRLLPTLRARLGAPVAIACTSVLFGVTHAEPWAVLVTCLVGLGLGTLRHASDSVAACVGMHVGLNLAVVACGLPPHRFVAPATLSAVASVGLATAAALLCRRHQRMQSKRRAMRENARTAMR